MLQNLTDAIKEYRKIIGESNVITDKKVLTARQTATFKTSQKVIGILKPANVDEVQACVRVANKYKTPLYPISTGLNWGYGSSVPASDNCIILDLSRLNRIIDYDEKLAYVTVEPGVTFQQLNNFLKKKKSNLIMSVSGGSPDSSLIGIVMERGIAKGPYGNLHEHTCNLEVVLPTGDCIHTGFGRFPQAKAKFVSKEGVGPSLSELFFQSNFGIVTKMTLWLLPRLKYFQVFTFAIHNNKQLIPLLNTLRNLKFERVIEGNFLIANEYRILDGMQQYPWNETHGTTPIPPQTLKRLKEKWKLSEKWYGSGALYAATKEIGISQRRYITKRLRGKVKSLYFIDEDIQKISYKLRKLNSSFINETLDKLYNDFINNTFLGIPSSSSLKSLYWRKKTTIPIDKNPDRDKCGVMWISPTIPFDGKQVHEAINIMEKTIYDYGFEPNLGISCITERMVYIIGAIIYDREVRGEDEKAIKCNDVLLKKLLSKGYLPYRLGIQSMDSLPTSYDDFNKFINLFKKTLDPNDILAPGRYDFRNN